MRGYMEILVIFESWNFSGFGDQRKGDSINLSILRNLAEMGYPLAKSEVFLGKGEYIAIVDKGKFVSLKPSQVYGEFPEENVRWIFRRYYGKAFRYSDIIRLSNLAKFYELNLEVFRGKEDIVMLLSSPSRSRVSFNLMGGKKTLGYFSASVFNLVSYVGRFGIWGQFDTSNFYSEFAGDIAENHYIPFGLFFEGSVGNEDIFYLIGIHRWYELLNLGVGLGKFGVIRLIKLDPKFEVKVFMSFGEVGFESFLRVWNIRIRAFKGIGKMKKPYGGLDAYREVSPLNSLEDRFFVLSFDLPIYSKIVRFGPFLDALFTENKDYTFGVFLNYGKLRMFLSRRGFFGISLEIER